MSSPHEGAIPTRKSTKRAALPPNAEQVKKPKYSAAKNRDGKVSVANVKTSEFDTSSPVHNPYDLPSFEDLPVGTALKMPDDGINGSWEGFDGHDDRVPTLPMTSQRYHLAEGNTRLYGQNQRV